VGGLGRLEAAALGARMVRFDNRKSAVKTPIFRGSQKTVPSRLLKASGVTRKQSDPS